MMYALIPWTSKLFILLNNNQSVHELLLVETGMELHGEVRAVDQIISFISYYFILTWVTDIGHWLFSCESSVRIVHKDET